MKALPFSLAEQGALITGGGTGIGFAIARCMVASGAKVVLAGRREAELARSAKLLGNSASYFVFDVTDFSSATAAIESANRKVDSRLSILVNNAGVHLKKPAEQTTAEDMRRVLDTHVVGSHALTAAAVPVLRNNGGGTILFTASMASLFGIPNVIAYSAAKSALLGVVRSLATEVSEIGIRVNAIAPGWIDSEMMRKALSSDAKRSDRILSRTPMKRFGEAEDVGWAAVYLASPAARFVTGVCLPVDGGVSIGF